MPEDRNRPKPQQPDRAALIRSVFGDEPQAPPAEPTPVGVVVPQGERPEGEAPPPSAPSPADTATPEGVVEAPPGMEDTLEAARAAAGTRWYVIHTYSGYENKVRTNLERRVGSMGMQEKIFRILVPTEDEIEIKDGKRRIAKKKVFPGYVLVEMIMDDDSWYVVRNTPGVTGFVGSGTKPLPLQEKEVKAILRQLGDETPKFRITYQKGSAVRINSGPFMDFSGVVDEILPEKEKVRVLVSIFGRETPVELDFAQVEKI